MRTLTAIHSIELQSGTAPDWVMLVPVGKFYGRDGRGPYLNYTPEEVVATSQRRAAGMDLGIDYDHQADFTKSNGGGAPASGWIKELEVREDGIYGRVEWTARATQAIEEGEYRYVSPVFNHLKNGQITCILRAALSNTPNLPLTALASQQDQEENSMEEFLALMAQLLGLPEGSDEKAVEAEIKKLQTNLSLHSQKVEAIAKATGKSADVQAEEIVTALQSTQEPSSNNEEIKALQASNNTLAETVSALTKQIATDKATSAVDAACKAGKLIPAQRDWAIAMHNQDPARFEEFIKTQPVIVNPNGETLKDPKVNDDGLDSEDLALCSQLGIDPKEYKKELGGDA